MISSQVVLECDTIQTWSLQACAAPGSHSHSRRRMENKKEMGCSFLPRPTLPKPQSGHHLLSAQTLVEEWRELLHKPAGQPLHKPTRRPLHKPEGQPLHRPEGQPPHKPVGLCPELQDSQVYMQVLSASTLHHNSMESLGFPDSTPTMNSFSQFSLKSHLSFAGHPFFMGVDRMAWAALRNIKGAKRIRF